MLPFLRLIRWKNLIIVALTMYGLLLYYHGFQIFDISLQITYHALVLAVVLITAGGNIINDYYDVEADKINKPKRLIVTKDFSEQATIRLYQTVNVIALIVLFIVSLKLEALFNSYIGISIIVLLYFYSKNWKKRGIFGNLLVSFLVGFIPIWSMLLISFVYFGQFTPVFSLIDARDETILAHFWIELGSWSLPIFLAILSFTINFIREIIKDLEDIEGDKKINSKAFAIQLGTAKTFQFLTPILSLTILYLLYGTLQAILYEARWMAIFPFILIIGILLIVLTLFLRKKEALQRMDALLKLALLIGCLLPVLWFLI